VNGRSASSGGESIAGLHAVLQAARPDADIGLIRRACDVAACCHQGQTRRSGDPYITHPVNVARILASLGADDQMLCAAILHCTVEDSPYTLAELGSEFGARTAAMVSQHMTLNHFSRRRGGEVSQAMAAMESADIRVVVIRLADRLNNMRTLQFLPEAKQLHNAREVLDIFVPAARQFSMAAVASELETLAFATLVRSQPARMPCHRAMVALDIERSTSRPDLVKAELRILLYELFDAALRSAGIYPRHRDRFIDRGDGLLALIHPAGQAIQTMLLDQVIPVLSRFLSGYNSSVPPQRQLRVRVVVHTGEVHYDANGCFGEALDVAFRLLDAPGAKKALKTADGPLVLVVSGDVYDSAERRGCGRTNLSTSRRVVSAQVAGKRYPGWIHIFSPAV
jgi:hypothetical protein